MAFFYRWLGVFCVAAALLAACELGGVTQSGASTSTQSQTQQPYALLELFHAGTDSVHRGVSGDGVSAPFVNNQMPQATQCRVTLTHVHTLADGRIEVLGVVGGDAFGTHASDGSIRYGDCLPKDWVLPAEIACLRTPRSDQFAQIYSACRHETWATLNGFRIHHLTWMMPDEHGEKNESAANAPPPRIIAMTLDGVVKENLPLPDALEPCDWLQSYGPQRPVRVETLSTPDHQLVFAGMPSLGAHRDFEFYLIPIANPADSETQDLWFSAENGKALGPTHSLVPRGARVIAQSSRNQTCLVGYYGYSVGRWGRWWGRWFTNEFVHVIRPEVVRNIRRQGKAYITHLRYLNNDSSVQTLFIGNHTEACTAVVTHLKRSDANVPIRNLQTHLEQITEARVVLDTSCLGAQDVLRSQGRPIHAKVPTYQPMPNSGELSPHASTSGLQRVTIRLDERSPTPLGTSISAVVDFQNATLPTLEAPWSESHPCPASLLGALGRKRGVWIVASRFGSPYELIKRDHFELDGGSTNNPSRWRIQFKAPAGLLSDNSGYFIRPEDLREYVGGVVISKAFGCSLGTLTSEFATDDQGRVEAANIYPWSARVR